jgi:hypothetical protein
MEFGMKFFRGMVMHVKEVQGPARKPEGFEISAKASDFQAGPFVKNPMLWYVGIGVRGMERCSFVWFHSMWDRVRFEVFTAMTMKNVVFWDIKA